MANAPVQFTCKTLNGQTLNNIIVSILEKSFRDGISALVWMNREIMIAMIHQAIDLINRSESMFINVEEDLLEQKMVFVVGSIDGDLINLVTLLKNEMPPRAYYIFLGDYLDCFKPSRIDALLLLLGLKLRHPRYICLFRGHHETYEMCKAIGFDKAIADERLLQSFYILFEYLPLLGVFGKFLCLHAGISLFMAENSFLQEFVKPIEVKRMTVRERSTLTDILYGRPDKDLPALFAPSNIYPIGYRFNLTGLHEVIQMFDCKRLIRGCGCRNSNDVNFDFDTTDCISVVSGRSIRHANYERFIIRIYENGQFELQYIDKDSNWDLRRKNFLEKSVNYFINTYDNLLQSIPHEFQFDLPMGCAACEWINQGKKHENVTISHALLKSFAKEMMYPRKLHDDFSFDPRLEQYVYAEIFPLCDDFYFYGTDQLVTPFPFIIEHPFIKPPMLKWHEEFRQTDAGPSTKEESDYRSYAYIDRIIRPGYDLKRNEQPSGMQTRRSHQDLQRLHQLQHWLRGVFAPRLSYKYCVERLSDDNE